MNKVALYLLLIASIFLGGFGTGIYVSKMHETHKEDKQIQVVVKKNDDLQKVSTEAEKTAVVYRDRIVTKYKPVIKEVIKYVDRENSTSDIIWINADWVRVHDDAVDAANGVSETPTTTAIPDASSNPTQKVGVKSGEVLRIVSDNYEAYSLCRVELTGLQKYVLNLNKEMTK